MVSGKAIQLGIFFQDPDVPFVESNGDSFPVGVVRIDDRPHASGFQIFDALPVI